MRRVTLNDVCDVTDGTHYTPPDVPGPFPFLTVKDMTDKGLSFSGCSYIDATEFEKAQKADACPEAGAVLFSKDGTVGKVHVVRSERPFAVLSSIAILRPDVSILDSNFLGFVLGNSVVLKDAVNRKTGSALQRIILSDLKDVRIPLPDLSEQREIARRLEQADRLRRTRRYALELTDTFLPAAFLELFGDPETNPRGWSESELGELCEEVLDCPHSTPIYAAIQTPHPCVRSSDIQRGYLDFSEAKYVSPSEYQKRIARGKPVRGDVIYCREGARFGNAARIIDKTEMCLGQRTMLFRVNSKVAVGEYIWAFLSSRGAYRQATRALDGSASPHVNVGEIVAFRVAVPLLSLQQRFASMCERVDRLRAVQREALRQAEHLFQTLLHCAFS
jgi:type I restriction enzyme, S subunit